MKTQIKHFLDTIQRSKNTVRAYRYALKQFMAVVGPKAELNTDSYVKFLVSIKNLSPSSQTVYRVGVLKFYAFCKSGNWAELQEATEHYTRKIGKRIVKFNREAIETVIKYCENLRGDIFAMRDRAFILTIADTGLRVAEACSLKRGDLDWQAGQAIIIGKGDKQAVIRFSKRSLIALKLYLADRSKLYPESKTSLQSQPLFASHDIRASKKLRGVSDSGMRKAIKGTPDGSIIGRIEEAGVNRNDVRIHDFRHFFVTMTYLAKRDLKLSQELARHESISTTNRYAHFGSEADEAYNEIFNK